MDKDVKRTNPVVCFNKLKLKLTLAHFEILRDLNLLKYITEVCGQLFRSLSREKSTQDEKIHFVKENELKLTQKCFFLFF